MRLVYIDEAGISNPQQDPHVIVAGVIVNGDSQLDAVGQELERILVKHIPEKYRDGFVFHATEIFNGGKLFRRMKANEIGPPEWPLNRRLAIANDLAAIPEKFDLPIAMGWVTRATFPQTFSLPQDWTDADRRAAAHGSAFLNCSMVCDRWMRNKASDENCLLIVEDNEQVRKIIRDLHIHHQDKKIEAILDREALEHFPFRKIKEDPLFQPKKPSHPLVVADFCAFVWKKILVNDSAYDQFFEPWRKKLIFFDPDWKERREKKLRELD